jgi:hypothetical protein
MTRPRSVKGFGDLALRPVVFRYREDARSKGMKLEDVMD